MCLILWHRCSTSPSLSGLEALYMNRFILMMWTNWENSSALQRTRWQVRKVERSTLCSSLFRFFVSFFSFLKNWLHILCFCSLLVTETLSGHVFFFNPVFSRLQENVLGITRKQTLFSWDHELIFLDKTNSVFQDHEILTLNRVIISSIYGSNDNLLFSWICC